MFKVRQNRYGAYEAFLYAGNGQVILKTEGYQTKAGMENCIESICRNALNDEAFERLESKLGKPYFVLKAKNGQIMGESEKYESFSARDNGIESVKRNTINAEIVYEK